MSNSIKRNLTKLDEAIMSIRDLYSEAKIAHLTSRKVSEKVADIMNSIADCPVWVRRFVMGYETCLVHNLYDTSLVFGCWIDGKFYSNVSSRNDYYQKQGKTASIYSVESNNGTLGHYWSDDVSKPYFI